MFQQIVEILEEAQNYVGAIQRGFDTFKKVLPVTVRQQMEVFSKQKLNSTQQTFMDAVKVTMADEVLVVELDPDNWLANAVETGADPFSLKEGHLRSPKAKTSKEGFKYIRIPIGKNKHDKPGTDKGKMFQQKILDVLNKPKFGIQKLKMKLDGSVSVSQKILTDDTDLKGFYRVQTFIDAQAYHGRKRPFRTDYILFRTMSEKPGTSAWEHPGIRPAHIFRETEKWLERVMDHLLDQMIEQELEKSGFK